MKQKIKNIFLSVLSCLITMALCLGCWFLGFFLMNDENTNRPVWTAACIICAVIAIALILTNIVGQKAIVKKFSGMKIRDINDWGETLKANVENDFEHSEKVVRRTIAFAYAYVVTIILILAFCCFCVGVLLKGEDSLSGSIAVMIIIVFVMWGLVDLFFTPLADPAPPSNYLLDEKRFPKIYETVRKACETSGCGLNIRIYLYGESASITVYKRNAIICLNYLHGAILTKDELFNVMLHEFAHIVNEDVKRSRNFSKAKQRFDSEGNNPIVALGKIVFLPLPAAAVMIRTDAYDFFASRHHEIEADKALKTLGNPQKSINALAKTKMVGLFFSAPHRELDYDFYAPEQLTGDYAAQVFALFLKYRDSHCEEWRQLIEKELPAKVDSHPTFNNRMAALGCESYDAYCVETDPAYAAEQQNIISAADDSMNADYGAKYEEIRKNVYVERKKLIDEYEEAEKSGREIPDYKLYAYIDAFMGIDDDIALKLADRAAALPNPDIANYYKANILFNRNDDECITYLKAIANSTDDMELALSASNRIGEYALKTGNEELLNEYRSTSPDLVQASRDKGERNQYNKSYTVEKCDIDEEAVNDFISGVETELMQTITAIYIGAYTDTDGAKHYPVAVCLKERNAIKNYKVMQQFYNYLFGFKGKYDFILLPFNTTLYRKVKKCGLQVYKKI